MNIDLRLDLVTDDDLLERTGALLSTTRRVEAELVAHLGEPSRPVAATASESLRLDGADGPDGAVVQQLRPDGADGRDVAALQRETQGRRATGGGRDRAGPVQGAVHRLERAGGEAGACPGAPPSPAPERRPGRDHRPRGHVAARRAREQEVCEDGETEAVPGPGEGHSELSTHPGAGTTGGVGPGRTAVHVQRRRRPAVPGARAPGVPSRGAVRATRRPQPVERETALSLAQRVPGRARLRPRIRRSAAARTAVVRPRAKIRLPRHGHRPPATGHLSAPACAVKALR
jgi:hypothetical protein